MVFSVQNKHGLDYQNNYTTLSYQYDYFEINKDLLEQVPTAEQAQQLIDLFAVLKRELPKENVEIYAKIIYTLLKKISNLSVFKSAEENIKLLDFLFEGFSKAKDVTGATVIIIQMITIIDKTLFIDFPPFYFIY